jgi:hypothetical protein
VLYSRPGTLFDVCVLLRLPRCDVTAAAAADCCRTGPVAAADATTRLPAELTGRVLLRLYGADSKVRCPMLYCSAIFNKLLKRCMRCGVFHDGFEGDMLTSVAQAGCFEGSDRRMHSCNHTIQ